MIEKLNIPIRNKLSRQIKYILYLHNEFWCKREYDSEGNQIYYEDNTGYWVKREYDNEGKRVYYETSEGFIRDDR